MSAKVAWRKNAVAKVAEVSKKHALSTQASSQYTHCGEGAVDAMCKKCDKMSQEIKAKEAAGIFVNPREKPIY